MPQRIINLCPGHKNKSCIARLGLFAVEFVEKLASLDFEAAGAIENVNPVELCADYVIALKRSEKMSSKNIISDGVRKWIPVIGKQKPILVELMEIWRL